MQLIHFLDNIDSQLLEAITDIRRVILNSESYNFSARLITKRLEDGKNCCYMAVIPNSIEEYPIDLLTISKNHKYMAAYAVCGDFCVSIPISEFVNQYEHYEAFCSLEGCYAIPSARANKIKDRFVSVSYPAELIPSLLALGSIAERSFVSDISKRYHFYAKEVISYRKKIIDDITCSEGKEPYLVIPYHR